VFEGGGARVEVRGGESVLFEGKRGRGNIQIPRNLGKIDTCANSGYQALLLVHMHPPFNDNKVNIAQATPLGRG